MFAYDAQTQSVTYISPWQSCVPWWSPGSWQAIVSLLNIEKVNNTSNKRAQSKEFCTVLIWTYTYTWDGIIFLPLLLCFLIHLEVLSGPLIPFHPETYNTIRGQHWRSYWCNNVSQRNLHKVVTLVQLGRWTHTFSPLLPSGPWAPFVP